MENISSQSFSLFLSFSDFGIGLGFVMSFGQLSVRRKQRINYLLSLLFFSIACILLYLRAFAMGWVYDNPCWAYTVFPFIFLTAPVLRWIAISASEEKVDFSTREATLFAPFVVSIGIPWIPFLIGDYDLQKEIRRVYFFGENPGFGIWEICMGVSLAYVAFCLFLVVRKYWNIFQLETLKREKAIAILVFIVAVSFFHTVYSMAYLVFKSEWILKGISIGLVLYLIAAYWIGHRVPEFFQRVREIAIEEKVLQSRSQLEGVDLEALGAGLISLMEDSHIYRDENLSLSDLADELAFSIHQVSEYLNRILKKNFAQFVNEYRVKEAKELLLKDRDKTVLEIGMEVGFATKSSFHRAFTKYAGMTPGEWRQKKVPDYNIGRQSDENLLS